MLGNFQQSHLRIEIEANKTSIRDSLLQVDKLKQWMWPQSFSANLSDKLQEGLTFTSFVGPIEIDHQVEIANDFCLRFLLSKSIDGYHEWYWGDGWIQSRLEGISALPLNLGQTLSLLRLRQFLSGISKI